MRGLLFLLSALLLLESTDGDKEYHQLSQHDKNIIDKAIQLANAKYGTKHLDFASIFEADFDKRMLHVILRSTSCDKMTPSVHREDCKIQDKERPHVSCVDCGGSMSCLRFRETDKTNNLKSECLNPSKKHFTGEGSPISHKAGNGQQTGCLGCI